MSSYTSEVRVLQYGTFEVQGHVEDAAAAVNSGREHELLVEFDALYTVFPGGDAPPEKETRKVFINPHHVQFVRENR